MKKSDKKTVLDYLASQAIPKSKAEIQQSLVELPITEVGAILTALVKENKVNYTMSMDGPGVPYYSAVTAGTYNLDPDNAIDALFIQPLTRMRELAAIEHVEPVSIANKKDKLKLLSDLAKTPFLPHEKLELLTSIANDLKKLEESA